jgi:hypothetical protein
LPVKVLRPSVGCAVRQRYQLLDYLVSGNHGAVPATSR